MKKRCPVCDAEDPGHDPQCGAYHAKRIREERDGYREECHRLRWDLAAALADNRVLMSKPRPYLILCAECAPAYTKHAYKATTGDWATKGWATCEGCGKERIVDLLSVKPPATRTPLP